MSPVRDMALAAGLLALLAGVPVHAAQQDKQPDRQHTSRHPERSKTAEEKDKELPMEWHTGGTVTSPPPKIRMISPLPNGEWKLPAGDLANTRYSPLDQINTSNVSKLQVKSTLATGIPHGHEGQPLVVGHVMYIVTPFPNNLIAVDLTKPGGALMWIYQPHPNPKSVGIACCDVVNRGASYADGKIIYPRWTARPSRSMRSPATRCGARSSATSTSARRSPWRRWWSRTR